MKVFLCTADASGDLHGAALVDALRQRCDRLELVGLGGDALQAAGLEAVVDPSDLAVAGLVEVLSSLPRLVRAYATLRRSLLATRPDIVVLIDSPDLNLPLAAVAARRGLPVLYYIAPQVWAWRPGRLRKLRRRVNHVGVIFPFEEALLRAAGVPASFVGHPLVDRMAALRKSWDRAASARSMGVDPSRPLLGLLPGSRRNELRGNLPLMLETAEMLHAALPDLQIRLGLAPMLEGEPLELPGHVGLVRGRSHELMALSSCLLCAPGTVTLEAALLGTPLVVTHRMNRLSFAVAQRVMRVASACMVNLVAEAGVVPERLQGMARPAALCALLAELVREPAAAETMRRELARVSARLGPPGAAGRAAELVLRTAAGRAPA